MNPQWLFSIGNGQRLTLHLAALLVKIRLNRALRRSPLDLSFLLRPVSISPHTFLFHKPLNRSHTPGVYKRMDN